MTNTDDHIVPTIGESLRNCRKVDQNPKIHPMSLTGTFTQEDLAKRTGLSIPTIRNLENGNGTIDSLKRVLDESELVLDIYYPLNKEEKYRPLNKEEEEMIFTKSGSGKPYLRIGTQIKLLRRQKGYSQRKLAELVKVSHPTIVKMERHEKGRLSVLESIVKSLSGTITVLPMDEISSTGYPLYSPNA